MKLRILAIFLSTFISITAHTERTPDECFKLRRYGIATSSWSIQGWAISKFKHELAGCKSKSLYIPNEIKGKKVLLIDPQTFKGLGLKFVKIGKNMNNIGNRAFKDNKISSVVFNNDFYELDIGYSAFENNKIASLTLPKNLISIGKNAFANNKIANNVNAEMVDRLGVGAFQNNQLKEASVSYFRDGDMARAFDEGVEITFHGIRVYNNCGPNFTHDRGFTCESYSDLKTTTSFKLISRGSSN